MDSVLQQAEQGLVGAALLDPKSFHEANLRYLQFFDPACQVAWKAIGETIAAGKELDPITVADRSNGKLSPVDLSRYIANLGVPNILEWSNIVRENYVKRGVATVASDFERWSNSGMSGPEMLTKVRERIEELENANEQTLPTLAQAALSECERIRNSAPSELQGLPTDIGIERVVPGGIPRGKVTTLFGESGNFKTTVKNNIVLGIASAGYRVLDVSLEDADELTAHRFIASCTGLNYGRIAAYALSESDRKRLDLPEKALKAASNVILAGEILPNIDEIIRTARFYKYKTGLDAVVIDYVQLLEGRNPRQTAKELLDEVMRKCQLAAKRDNMAYIIVSQVKQDVDGRTDHRPRITDMLGSSAMRTASKLSIGVYRPSLYHDTPPKGSSYEKLVANHPNGKEVYKNLLELHLLKNVLGEPRVIIHCRVYPGTGHMVPFDMSDYR